MNRLKAAVGRDQRGQTLVLTAMGMVAMLGMVALAVDLGWMLVARTEAQRSVDAAAMAGVGALTKGAVVNPPAARAAAIQYAAINSTARQPLVVSDNPLNDPTGGLVIGRVDDIYAQPVVFTPTMGNDANAVYVQARQTMGLWFAKALGFSTATVGTNAIAVRAAVSGVPAVPLGLRARDFGVIDPKINIKNPGKAGPSLRGGPGEVWETEELQIGAKVYIAAHGHGRQTGISLVLDMDTSGFGKADEAKILEGLNPPVAVEIGQNYHVYNQGTTDTGTKIEERIENFPWNHEMRTVVLPVVQTLENLGECCSRNSEDEIVGRLQVVDFVAVHLDGWEDVEVEDLETGQLRESLHVVGTVVKINVEASGIRNPSELVPGTSVATLALVQ